MAAWSPLRHPVFRALWIATLVSNIGTWMQNAAAAWFMTALTTSPVMVAFVQTATSLPLFLLALPAGAVADVFDRRRLIIFTQCWMLASAVVLGTLTVLGRMTPWTLLALTLLLSLGAAMNAPAWQAIVPELVPREDLQSAVALNSAGFNLARSVGPAIGGFAVTVAGPGIAFYLNAASFLGVIAVLFLWRRPPNPSTLPAEHIPEAIRTGLRYVRHAHSLTAILVRSATFMLSGIALLSLLPLIARQQLILGSLGYGTLLGFFGAGAVLGAAVLPVLQSRMSSDRLVNLATVLFAAVLFLLAHLSSFPVACADLAAGGAAWLIILGTLNATVQTVVPSWVRGRAIAVYMFIIFGAMSGGSALWGYVASFVGVSTAVLVAASALSASLVLTLHYRLPATETLDLTPSMHWPQPQTSTDPHPDRGPVLILIEYRIKPEHVRDFVRDMQNLRTVRLRDGAIRWSLYADASDPDRYIESFMVHSWIEHLRQHERITVADRKVENLVRSYHTGEEPPRVTHLVGVSSEQ